MTFGWFTPTEAAIAACAWALILGFFLYRSLSLKQFYKVTMDTIETTAGVLLIVAAASLFGWVLTTTRVTEYATEALLSITDNRYVILLLVNVAAAGRRMLPRADRVDQHPGPGADAGDPEGRHRSGAFRRGDDAQSDDRAACIRRSAWCCSCSSRIAKLSLERTTMAILPWLIPLLMSLVAITLIPELTLWLPRLAGLVK